MRKLEAYNKEWEALNKSGNFKEAEELYYRNILPITKEKFKEEFAKKLLNDKILISILGFSPEPIILTASAMSPKKHIVCTTEHNKKVISNLSQNLEGDFQLKYFGEDDFANIYKVLKEVLVVYNTTDVVIDITGGKKSTVAASAIFGKDYRCKIVYVDFDEYLPELRKPVPGSEVLKVVYDPVINQPEIFIE